MATAGIDIGGTQLRAALFDDKHQIIDVFKTANDPALTAEQNVDTLLEWILAKKLPTSGIGIGCPGPLDIPAGKVLTPPNLVGWDNFEIVSYVQRKTGINAALNNDANVAGLAEAVLGAGAGFDSVVYITISTGIGGAYVYRGELVNGAHSNAAEFWTMIVNEDPTCHGNVLPGTLNEQSSGSGIALMASRRFGREVSTRELFDLYHKGDLEAAGVISQAADALAKGIANIACTIDPEVYVIGGGVAIHQPDYVELVLERAHRYVLGPEYLNVRAATFGDDAGIFGASLLV